MERPRVLAAHRAAEVHGLTGCGVSGEVFLGITDNQGFNRFKIFQVFATCSTFYVPLLVILVLYWKIYQTARRRINRRRHHHHEKKQKEKVDGSEKAAGTGVGGAVEVSDCSECVTSKRLT